MKNIALKIFIVIILCIFGLSYYNNLKTENIRLKSNQNILLLEKESLMTQSQAYKVSDSLNAAKVSALQLTVSEYEKYRAQDLALIKALKIRKANLDRIVSTQIETINTLGIKLRDSIKIDTVTYRSDTVKYFSYKSKYIDVSGCIDIWRDTLELKVHSREELKVIETVKYKRFLGFLWKTNKIKSRQLDIISKNPCTSIINTEYIIVAR